MDIREIDGLWCDDITFCPERCGWKSCPRNKLNIRDRTVPHSFAVEIPQDCPKQQERVVKRKREKPPFESMSRLITSSFLTNDQVKKIKDTFKDFTVVVRCKDCQECYYASNRVPSERTYSCGKHGIDVTLDWFCADGVAKDINVPNK